jgi:hypothetical protein
VAIAVPEESEEDLGTNLQALRRTPGTVPHRHGPNPEHVHPDEAHKVFSHSHEYDVQDIGAVGTYSAGMWRALQKDRPSDSHGPEHWHLQHRKDK